LVAIAAALVGMGTASWATIGEPGEPAPTTTTVPVPTVSIPVEAGAGELDDTGEESAEVPESPFTVPGSATDQLAQIDPNLTGTDVRALEDAYSGAVLVRASLAVRVASLTANVNRLDTGIKERVIALSDAQSEMQQQIVAAYVRGGESIDIDDTQAVFDQIAALSVMGAVMQDDQTAIDQYAKAKAQADAAEIATADQLARVQTQLEQAKGAEVATKTALEDVKRKVKVKSNGGSVYIGGFFFPVDAPHEYVSSWHFPRAGHLHQGNDIMAPTGTKLFACETGVVTKIGNGGIGGKTLWIKGVSGTSYYYAHLSSFAASEGQQVSAGDVVGAVGTSGNAAGGAAHLHFEIHPGGGKAIDPYPTLVGADPLR
jgi:murein DD-endopeptidase MepM/ murein hydrolase activator NlpD